MLTPARYSFFLFFFCQITWAQPGQITLPRVEQMPNQPAPYNVRDWKEVALKYDSFVYDETKTGQYLPFVSIQPAGTNYPTNPAFRLHTYVGTGSPLNSEAVNVLPSLVGATLAGADKSNQYGRNWVLMSQNFFNKNNGELLYLNNPSTSSGNDWWYDLMPNIYFYQLYDLYPDLGGDEAYQFTTVADRFLGAVKGMGGADKPWHEAYMNYRAWDFSEMQPNTTSVPEPEAAGAYAWVLYHAWKQTGNADYLKGAEWSMEFLSNWTSNPSYELQLPYGIYAAAKMNAELNTDYDIEKMMNWAFNRGPLRGWGSIVGTWGSFDVDGLIGEANDGGNDYAFQMNGFHQAAALAPAVRYDKRFARAIGKWILNLANASRLFYAAFLPGSFQDATAWSDAHDPDHVIGYEALREQWQGHSPFSTGDALNGGWAATNLSLYSTSSVGYLGAILEKTNVQKILKIDLLKTDFFGDQAYPTYLLYNPYDQSQTVVFDAGAAPADLYEALSESFVAQNVNGMVDLAIPANQAVVVTIAPAGGVVTYDRNKMLINGVVVDYMQSAVPYQFAPRIQALASAQPEVVSGDTVSVYATAFDKDSDNLTYAWSAASGSIAGSGATVVFHAPTALGPTDIQLIVADPEGNKDTTTLTIEVVMEINLAPQILEIHKSAGYTGTNGVITLNAEVNDPNSDPITYDWTSTGGTFSGSGNSVDWMAPATEGSFQVTLTVHDDEGLTATKTISLWVRNFTPTSGNLVAWYPFSGNADDASGHQLHGQASGGAYYINDVFGQPGKALFTDGINDRITVANDPLLNFQNAITVSFWFRPDLLPSHEIFTVSHGSWQNRWKVSVTPELKIRWTVNTLNAIGDLDSDFNVQKDSVYFVTVTYDGLWMAMYVNGELRNYKTLSGSIRTTTLPLLIGQMLPDVSDYNFRGLTDEVKIFDYALTPDAATQLYEQSIITDIPAYTFNTDLILFPNPVTNELTIQLPERMRRTDGRLCIFNMQGQAVATMLVEGETTLQLPTETWLPGIYQVIFNTDKGMAVGKLVKMK